MPTIKRKLHASKTTRIEISDFDADALRSLTHKTVSNSKDPDKGAISKNVAARPTANIRLVGKQSGQHAAKTRVSTSTLQTAGNGDTPMAEQKRMMALQRHQGRKRLRAGRTKNEGDGTEVQEVEALNIGDRKLRSDYDNNIGEEMRALGGTKEDVDLIADAASDSEMEGNEVRPSKKLRSSLEKEIEKLVRQVAVHRLAKTESINDFAPRASIEIETIEDNRHPSVKLDSEVIGVKPTAQKDVGNGQRSLLFQPQSDWLAAKLPPLPTPLRENSILPFGLLDRLHSHARQLLENENAHYAKSDTSSSAHRFYSTILSTGTLSDKISALTLSVQESPVHNMKCLESLVDLAGKRSRGQAVEVLRALKDLFGPGNLLPSDRKLRTFVSQPALANAFDPSDFHWTSKNPLPANIKEVHLVAWAYEDWLKSIFFEVLKIIETWCNDEVLFARSKAIDIVYQLLKEKPEQEANLLRLLVNKLGDSDKRVASKTSFRLLQLEAAHPLMKPTIIAAIESDLLFRPNQSLHAKYYASITLNQTVLSGKEGIIARKLFDIYFSLFIELLDRPQEARPAATGSNVVSFNKKGEVQGGGGSAGKKAHKKLAEENKATTVDEDLREKILSAVLAGVNRAVPFMDTRDESFERHLNTLFRVTHSSNFNTSIQALMLIQQLNGARQSSTDRFYRTLYESLLDHRLLTSSKQTLYLNLLFRALRSDLSVNRVKAFIRRLLQVVAMHQPSFICGTFYLIRELEGVFASLDAFIDQGEEDSDGEEDFRDVQEPLPNGITSGEELCPPKGSNLAAKYDGRKRDPNHSNADSSSLWEATPFLQHYHPSVALFATRLLDHDEMPPKPDLSQNTLIHFLDRFVYRNPKATNAPRGASIMQPMAGGDSSTLLVSALSDKSRTQQPVNSEGFWKQETEKVNADEIFFHKYFSTLGRGKEKASKRRTERKADAKDSEDKADEDEIWEVLLESKPKLDEGGDSDFGTEETESRMEEMDDDNLDLDLIKADSGAESSSADGVEGLSYLDDEDNAAFVDSDDEVPIDLEEAFDDAITSSKPDMVQGPVARGKRGSKRHTLKGLPTFASADDYAKILEEDD